MIIALLALACAMIVGGLLAAFFGWDIVLVERGWTMVIAGSITAASGAILLGIAVAVSRLARIESQLSRLQGGSPADPLLGTSSSVNDLAPAGLAGGLVAGQAAADADTERSDEAQPTLPLFAEEGRSEREEPAVTAAEWPEDRVEPPGLPFPPRTTAVPAPSADEEETGMKVPDFLLADRSRDADEEPRGVDTGILDTGVNVYEREAMDREPEAPQRDERDHRPKPLTEDDSEHEPELQDDVEPAAQESDQDAAPQTETDVDEARPATVVGTYNSGDNRYVMFSDGSIEAHTPSGVFRFKSLEELKEFIAAGGEQNSSASI